MPDLARVVARALNRGDDDIMDCALALRGSPSHGPDSLLRDRTSLLKRLVLAPWRLLWKATPLASSTVVFDVTLTGRHAEDRALFVRHHFGEEVDFVSAATPRRVRGGLLGWLRWYLFGIWIACRGLVDASPRRYFWLGAMLLEIQALALAAPGIEKAYVFRLFDRRPYLAATFLARWSNAEVLSVFQNIPLWRNCRCFHLETPVVLTSKVNVPEVAYLQKEGLFRSSDIRYRSQEYVGAAPEVAHEPTVDIGFFSSGEWARRDGLYQAGNTELIARGEFLENRYAVEARELLDSLVRYAHERGRTLRIYPHPYERRLLLDHGIQAPYASLIDGELISRDDRGEDSRSKMYEPKVAVSLQSSFIWERLDLDLKDSFIHEFSDPEMNVFKRESLGEYSRNVFSNEEELRVLLDASFGG